MKAWLASTLKNEYQFIRVIQRSEHSEIKLYRHKTTAENIVVQTVSKPIDTTVYDALKRIRHPNLLEVYDVFTVENDTVILEEYVDGITLAENAGNLNPLGVKRVIIQLCQGLSALHGIGIVHQDVKLSNIMLTNNGTVKLIDYDIAKIYHAQQSDGKTLGTVGYAPFEQYGIGNPDDRSDLFAVGVTANLLLTGKHPSVSLYTKGKLGKMIAVCTHINPEKRFQSADAIIQFLT